jgi:crossover junction endodeoxyribonuclease RusA
MTRLAYATAQAQRAATPPREPVTPSSSRGFYAPRSVSLTLPFPPSTNTYWRRNGSRYFIARAGKLFRLAVIEECSEMRLRPLEGRLAVTVTLFPPDRRKRDIDNFGGKALLDALMHAGVYHDDSQIDLLVVTRMPVMFRGECHVMVEEMS